MTHALNARQEAFCRHYVLGASAAAAARQAGYAAATARSQAWRLLQQAAVQARIDELRADRSAAAAALCGRLWEQVDAIRDAALAKGQHGTALRAVTTQLRLFERLGLPARAADTYDILVEGAAAEAGAALTDVDIAALSEVPTRDDADADADACDLSDALARDMDVLSDAAPAAGDDTDVAPAHDPEMAALLRAALTEALGALGGTRADRPGPAGNVLPALR